MQPNIERRRDIWLIVFSSLGILGLFIRAVYLVVQGVLSNADGLASSVLGAIAMLVCSALLLPMLILSAQRLKGRDLRLAAVPPVRFWQVGILIVVWVVVVVADAVLGSLFSWGWIVATPFFLLGILLPLLGLLWIAIGGLPSYSVRRLWATLGIAMVGSTLAALLLEYLVLGVAMVGVGIVAASNPTFLTTLTQIVDKVRQANPGDMQSLLTLLAPYITNPLVIIAVLFFAAVLTPLIEEALKPLAVWLIGKRLRSPAEGFLLGAICGAGFAIMEGFAAASGATQMMGFGLIARGAASLMHITASGIMGWGIASAVLEKRYGRLALTYLISVSIHGLWNGSAVLAVYGSLRTIVQNNQLDLMGVVSVLAGLGGLLVILVLIATALPLINQALRRTAAPSIPQEPGVLPPQATPDETGHII